MSECKHEHVTYLVACECCDCGTRLRKYRQNMIARAVTTFGTKKSRKLAAALNAECDKRDKKDDKRESDD